MYPIRCDRVKQRGCKKIKKTAANERRNEKIQKESINGNSQTKDRKIKKTCRDISNKFNISGGKKGMVEKT
jgi:hypothetical protein